MFQVVISQTQQQMHGSNVQTHKGVLEHDTLLVNRLPSVK